MNVSVVDFESADAATQFVSSLKQTGFAVLVNHPIKQSLLETIYSDWQLFFNGKDKNQFLFNKETQDGFFPVTTSETAKGHTKKDIKEYFHVYPWGQIPDSLRNDILDYYNKASDFAATLLDWVEACSPEDVKAVYKEKLSSMIENTPNTLLRVLHYPPLSGDEEVGAIRAAAHEDINLLTILPAANAPGLQVQLVNGDWLDVPCDFGSLIINTGDMLQEASGGYFPSTSHRVINPEGQDNNSSRISLPLFLHPRSDVVLSDKHTQHSYLMERLKELGVK